MNNYSAKWIPIIMQYWGKMLIGLIILLGSIKIMCITVELHKIERGVIQDIRDIKEDLKYIKYGMLKHLR